MLLIVNVLVWKKIFKRIVLVMHFPRHANVVQQMKKDRKISNMSLLNLHKQIYKNAIFGQKNLGRVSKSGKKLVLKTEHTSENKVLFIIYPR